MITDKINHASMALGELAGKVSPEEWDKIRAVQAELADAAELAEAVENSAIQTGKSYEERQ